MIDRRNEGLDPIRATYDTVARRYAEEFAGDLAEKVLDRALLGAFAEMARSRAVEGFALGAPHAAGAAELVGDFGCGPGFEAKHLADLGLAVIGIDCSKEMIAEAFRRHGHSPRLDFRVGSLLELPFADGSLQGAIAIYSVIHLQHDDRARAYREMARVVRPGGPLLLSVHVSAPDFPSGSCRHLDEWWGERVALDGYFLDPDEVSKGLSAAGFEVRARLLRGPCTPREFPSQRAYFIGERRPSA
jgi:SAM-dependent methyltransferase